MKLGALNAFSTMGQRNEESEVTTVKSKLVVVGDCGCGKTSMINKYVKGHFSEVRIINKISVELTSGSES